MPCQAGNSAVASQQSAGGGDASSTASIDCIVYALVVQQSGSKACVIGCITCARAVHMSCLIDQYKQTDVTLAQSRNSFKWL